MKALVLLAIAGSVTGCAADREVQMSMENVQLVKIDTIQRYATTPQKLFTWRSDDNVNYITYEPMNTSFPLGARMMVMLKR